MGGEVTATAAGASNLQRQRGSEAMSSSNQGKYNSPPGKRSMEMNGQSQKREAKGQYIGVKIRDKEMKTMRCYFPSV